MLALQAVIVVALILLALIFWREARPRRRLRHLDDDHLA